MTVPTIVLADLPADAVSTGTLLLDVRENDEWAAGHIDGALHVPMRELPGRLADEPGALTPDRSIVVVCAMGGRSAQVTAWLVRQGYDAVNLAGGMHAWEDAQRPMTSETGATPRVL